MQDNVRQKFKELSKVTWKQIKNNKEATKQPNTAALSSEQQEKLVRYMLEALIKAKQHDKTHEFRDFLDRN